MCVYGLMTKRPSSSLQTFKPSKPSSFRSLLPQPPSSKFNIRDPQPNSSRRPGIRRKAPTPPGAPRQPSQPPRWSFQPPISSSKIPLKFYSIFLRFFRHFGSENDPEIDTKSKKNRSEIWIRKKLHFYLF